jgi:hypothetical protein
MAKKQYRTRREYAFKPSTWITETYDGEKVKIEKVRINGRDFYAADNLPGEAFSLLKDAVWNAKSRIPS